MEKIIAFFKNKTTLHGQIIKYLFFGGITCVVDFVVFYLFAWLVFPSLRATDPFNQIIGWFGGSITPVNEKVLIHNFYINKVICFFCSNTVAYITNLLFVFNDGRHNRLKEGLLFYTFSIVSFVLFTAFSAVLIKNAHWDVTYSNIFVFTLAMFTNFTFRKKFIFKK